MSDKEEKVTVVNDRDGNVTVHRTRKSGADKARKSIGEYYVDVNKKALGKFIENPGVDSVSTGGTEVTEVTVQD